MASWCDIVLQYSIAEHSPYYHTIIWYTTFYVLWFPDPYVLMEHAPGHFRVAFVLWRGVYAWIAAHPFLHWRPEKHIGGELVLCLVMFEFLEFAVDYPPVVKHGWKIADKWESKQTSSHCWGLVPQALFGYKVPEGGQWWNCHSPYLERSQQGGKWSMKRSRTLSPLCPHPVWLLLVPYGNLR